MKIYKPSEDSYLMQDVLISDLKNSSKNIKILDMGTGSGILALTCKKLGFKSVFAADINKEAIKKLSKADIKVFESDLFKNINEKFDLIIFNPPYLPEHKYDLEKDTTGGKLGFETINNFLKQAKKHLNKNAKILLLYSSYSKPEVIKKFAKKLGYKQEIKKTLDLPFEKLFVYELSN